MEDLNRWAGVINDTLGKVKFNLQTLDEMKKRRTTKNLIIFQEIEYVTNFKEENKEDENLNKPNQESDEPNK